MEKIALLGPTHPYRGGIASHTTFLCDALRAKHEVTFFSYASQYPKWLFPGKTDRDTSADAFTTDSVQYLLDPMKPWTWHQTARAIYDCTVQRLVVPWWVVFWAPCYYYIIRLLKFWQPKLTVTFMCHNVIEHEDHFLKRFLTKRVLSLGDSFVVQSGQDEERLRQLIGRRAGIVRGFHPIYEEIAKKHAQVTALTEEAQKTILFFGFIRHYKGLDILLQAFARMQDKGAKLLVVGECWKNFSGYTELAKSLGITGRVTFVNEYVPNEAVGNYFKRSAVVALPYRSASGSGICQMAYSYGMPVVGSAVGSIAEVVDHNHNGFLVQPESPDALALALTEALKPSTNKRLRRGVLSSRHKYSWEALANIISNSHKERKEEKLTVLTAPSVETT